jgi:hypothetical protein
MPCRSNKSGFFAASISDEENQFYNTVTWTWAPSATGACQLSSEEVTNLSQSSEASSFTEKPEQKKQMQISFIIFNY